MSLNIKNRKAHELAERVARIAGETLTEAVTKALKERLDRLEDVGAIEEGRLRELKAVIKGSRRLWLEPNLSVEHGDLLYDEFGLPK